MANVVVVNPVDVLPGLEEAALDSWNHFAEFFRRQPGYVSAHLFRATETGTRFRLVTIAEWESTEHFAAALNSPAARALLATVRPGITYHPGVYEVVGTSAPSTS